MIFVTGGAGFIGSNFVLDWLAQSAQSGEPVVNLDSLTYAGNLENLASLSGRSGTDRSAHGSTMGPGRGAYVSTENRALPDSA